MFLASDDACKDMAYRSLHPCQSITHTRARVEEEGIFFYFLPTTDALSYLAVCDAAILRGHHQFF